MQKSERLLTYHAWSRGHQSVILQRHADLGAKSDRAAQSSSWQRRQRDPGFLELVTALKE